VAQGYDICVEREKGSTRIGHMCRTLER
jgi:hypothetical protein